jgi:hypothetical protein
MMFGSYVGTKYPFILTTKNYKRDTVVIFQASYETAAYKTNVFTTNNFKSDVKLGFSNAWLYKTGVGIDKTIKRYYGTGTEWKEITEANAFGGNLEVTQEDLTEELDNYNTSLTTQETSIQDIIEALKGKAAGGGGAPEVEPAYITDGLVAWFDGADKPHGGKYWINKVGYDYIYEIYGRNLINGDNAYKNDKTLVMMTSADYYKEGYTIEVVGKINSQVNSDSPTSGGWFITMNHTSSVGVGVSGETGTLRFVNNTDSIAEKTYNNCYQKRISAAVHLKDVGPRGSTTNVALNSSANGEDWYSITAPYGLGVAFTNHAILCYYARTDGGATYRVDGEINCIRIYKRQLTKEELAYNHAIDKARFNTEDLED